MLYSIDRPLGSNHHSFSRFWKLEFLFYRMNHQLSLLNNCYKSLFLQSRLEYFKSLIISLNNSFTVFVHFLLFPSSSLLEVFSIFLWLDVCSVFYLTSYYFSYVFKRVFSNLSTDPKNGLLESIYIWNNDLSQGSNHVL